MPCPTWPDRRPLYVMVKPPRQVRAQVARLSRHDRRRTPALLHVTLLWLGDVAGRPGDYLNKVRTALRCFDGPPFRLVFERIEEGSHVTLCGTEAMRGVARVQEALERHLLRHGIASVGGRPRPHMTLRYARDGRGSEWIDALSWQAQELLLVESMVGLGRHLDRGHWTLRAD